MLVKKNCLERESENFYFFIEFDGSISCVPNTFIGLLLAMEHISIYKAKRSVGNYQKELWGEICELKRNSRQNSFIYASDECQ